MEQKEEGKMNAIANDELTSIRNLGGVSLTTPDEISDFPCIKTFVILEEEVDDPRSVLRWFLQRSGK